MDLSNSPFPLDGTLARSPRRYAYQAQPFYGFGNYTYLALNSALALLLLSIGIFFARPERGLAFFVSRDSPAGVLLRVLFPAAIFVPIALGWLRIEGQRIGLYSMDTGVALFVLANVLIFIALVLSSAALIYRSDNERLRSEEGLREAEDRYRTLVEHIPAVIYIDANDED